MTIEAVLFDIGGVLEDTPRTGWEQRWATQLGMSIEEFKRRFARFMGDLWEEYLGTLTRS